jgi:tetratricopeptide (TPR) repeat protein
MAGLWNLEPLDFAVDALRDSGDMFDLAATVYHAADVCYHAGAIDEAFERVRAINAATARLEPGAPASVRGTWLVEGFCGALRGQPDERRFQETREMALAMNDIVICASALHDWGEMLERYGRLEEGLEKLEEGYDIWKRRRLLDGYSSTILYRLPRAYLKLPALDRARARRLRLVHADAMRKTRRAHQHWRSPTLVNEALLLERAGKKASADQRFREAVDVARRQNAGLFVSNGLYDWGVVLLDRGDADGAAGRLEEALRIALGGGNQWLAHRCREALARVPANRLLRQASTGTRA